MTDADDTALRRDMVGTCRAVTALGLGRGASADLSARSAPGLLVTPGGLSWERMQPDDLVRASFTGGSEGDWRPAPEWRLHRDILAAYPVANCVLRCRSVHATTLAVHGRAIPSFHHAVARFGGADVRCARYATPGSPALSDAALEALSGRTACLLAQHGQIALGRDLAEALENAVELEALARLYLQALALGEPPRLDDAEVARVTAAMHEVSARDANGVRPASGRDRGRDRE